MAHHNNYDFCPNVHDDHQQHLFDQFETEFLRPLVREEVAKTFEAHFNRRLSSSSEIEEVAAAGSGSETMNMIRLCFDCKVEATVFTNNNIKSENGQPLRVELCDTTYFDIIMGTSPVIVGAGPLSSALIELVVLDGSFGHGQQEEEIHWDVADFNQHILTKKYEHVKQPLIVGVDQKLRLQNGVAIINKLEFTVNSKWATFQTFRLGARIIDAEILAKYPRIGEAVSNPFKVKFGRNANKKHHPPMGEDEVYRLEGISKGGEYRARLSYNQIKTVDQFVKAYKRNPRSLKEMLGNNVSTRKWNAMVRNALEYVPHDDHVPTCDIQNLEENNEAMCTESNGQIFEDKTELKNFTDFLFEGMANQSSYGFSDQALEDKMQEYQKLI